MNSKRLLFLFEDDQVDNFYPLSLSHSPAELRCGILSLGDKWSRRIAPDEVRIITRDYLAAVLHTKLGIKINDFNADRNHLCTFVNPRFVPDDELCRTLISETDEKMYLLGQTVVAATINGSNRVLSDMAKNLKDLHKILADAGLRPVTAKTGTEMRYLFDLVAHNGEEIEKDFQLLSGELNFKRMFEQSEVDDAALIYRLENVYIGTGARIDGQVVLDGRSGPIYIGEKVMISPHTRVEGPAFIGADCQLVGGKMRSGCSFGPHCRVGGEIEESIIHGNSNKYHEGFVGHSYIGEWVNLGALTTNSDLKNNYGEIRIELPSGEVNSGLNKVGSFIGDHSKTGIGTLLTTGMVIGFSVNLFGGGLADARFLPSFLWGGRGGFVHYDVEKAISTARIVCSRRGHELTSDDEQLFRHLCQSTSERHRT